jgi:hypothetical protein
MMTPQMGGGGNNNNESSAETSTTVATLVQSILATSMSHLLDYGATRETAPLCLALLLLQPDLGRSELDGFVAGLVRIVGGFCTRWEARDEGDGTGASAATSTSLPPLLPMPDGPPLIFLVMKRSSRLATGVTSS